MPEIELSLDFDVAGVRMAEKEAKTTLLELPEDILYQIMSLLPTTPDVIAIGLSSKTLISAFRSFQLTSMDFRHPKIRTATKDTTEEFLNFMNCCITAFERSNTKTCPKRFRLQAPFKRMGTDSRIENAIGFAVRKGAKELDIDVGVFSYYSCYRKPHYPLPVQVIITHPSNSITTLNFKGLCISEGLNELILACPQIKKVDLTGGSVPSCTRFSSDTLESIHLAHIWSAEEYGRGLLTIEVKSPNLQNFVLSQGFSISLNNNTFIPIKFPRKCNFLKVLSLEKSSISDQWVNAYVSELVHLETLTLKECGDFNNLRISNHHKLRRIELLKCHISQSIEIGVVHLESLTAHSRRLYFGTFKFDMINASKHLKRLDICGYSLSQEVLEKEISQLTSLESLILNACCLFPTIKICQSNITSLELLNCENHWNKQILVDAQRLVSFIYSGDIIPLRVDCSKPFLEATMSTSSVGDPNFKLRTWFEFFGHCKTAKLVCKSYKDFTLPRKFRQKFTAPLSGLRRLTLEIGECTWSRIRRDLVENLLWLYPDLEAFHIIYRPVKENSKYVITVPCHDPKKLAAFMQKIRDDDRA